MNLNFFFETIIWQPTTLCNLNCRYCYLPAKDKRRVISDDTVLRLAQSIDEIIATGEFVNNHSAITLVWHGGEPLALGKFHFRRILAMLSPLYEKGILRHSIVTNGTLLDDQWIELFREYEFEVGVSLDGPEWANVNRVDRNLEPTFERIMRGISYLQKYEYPFYIISVVTPDNLNRGKEIYEFLASTGAYMIGFNLVEQEGAYKQRIHWERQEVMSFWQDVYTAWRNEPKVRIREFDSFYKWVTITLSQKEEVMSPVYIDLVPTISWDGKVTVISPELATTFGESNEFIIGDINQESLLYILKKAIYKSRFVREFLESVKLCQSKCPYFDYCLGGTPANKYFENGSLLTTETQYCRANKQWFLDAILDLLS